jgi:hypothetical protein
MGAWMDQQLRIGDSYLPKISQSSTSTENHSALNGEDASAPEYDLHPEVNSETSDAATLEQRRAYKIELQVSFLFIYKGWSFVVHGTDIIIGCFFTSITSKLLVPPFFSFGISCLVTLYQKWALLFL